MDTQKRTKIPPPRVSRRVRRLPLQMAKVFAARGNTSTYVEVSRYILKAKARHDRNVYRAALRRAKRKIRDSLPLTQEEQAAMDTAQERRNVAIEYAQEPKQLARSGRRKQRYGIQPTPEELAAIEDRKLFDYAEAVLWTEKYSLEDRGDWKSYRRGYL